MRARRRRGDLDEAFRVYLTECLRAIPAGRQLRDGWRDVSRPKPADPRTGDEIAADVIARAGLEVA